MAMRSQTTPPLHRLDVETYNRIVASGALEGQRVELLDGLIVEMSPQSPAHSTVLRRLMRHFAATPRWWTQVQSPIEVRPDSEPEPDLAVLDAEPSADEHPRTALLVIEVAVSSQLVDRNVKAIRYAQAGIPTYWLVDVPRRTVEVRTEPNPRGYERCEIHAEGSRVRCPLAGVADLDVAALLAGVIG
jgi:Uma2 family endonuclease